jgi:NAD(P)-dependent dehydrogenase (short-subunit alcohol dehydrogenase family)/dTDP-glucose pyrophosphorylase
VRALILAAGRGERLGPLTQERPKPMIEIGGKPILQWNVELLVRAGIEEIAINLHHAPGAILSHFGDGSRFGARIRFFHEPELLGTAGAVRNAADFLRDDDFLIVYGDNLSTIDLRKLVGAHRSKRAELTIALYRREDPGGSGTVTLGDGDRILAFVEKPGGSAAPGSWVNAGYLAARPALLDALPQGPADLGRDVIPHAIACGKPVYGYRMSEELFWIDSPEDYRKTAALHPQLRERSVVVTGASMGIGEATARVCLAAGARVTICARGAQELHAAWERLNADFPGAVAQVTADVSKAGDVTRLFDAATGLGRVDAVVHAAAVLGPVAAADLCDPDEWLRTVEIDLFGAFLVTREALRRFANGGRIVLFSGGGAGSPWPDHTAYACSKAAVVRFVETVAQEVRDRGIEINAIAPGLVATRMTAGMETGRAVPRERGARAAAFFVSEAARGITGRFVSAVYDRYWSWPDHREELAAGDLFTLRRILPRERGMNWQ